MSKKIMFATISIQPQGQLKKLTYHKENTAQCYPTATAFPSIAMIEENVQKGDDVRIIAIMAQDADGRSARNLEVFKEELACLNTKHGWNLQLNDTILLPHEETRQKQIQLFRKVCEKYEEHAKIYLDITYGTKITSIGIFSTLVYAENVKHCEVCSVIYGKYLHQEQATGELYDIKCLYDLNMLISDLNPNHGDVNSLLDTLWG